MARTINGRYHLVDEKSRPGGFCDVYKAYDLGVDPPPPLVAIKVLRAGAHTDEVGNASVAREFESLQRLRHENIVNLVEANIDGETRARFLALEWIESSMDAYLEGGEAQPDDFIAGIGLQISAAMAFACENDVAHRDLKPANVLITDDGIVKVADFGISRVLDWLDDRSLSSPTLADYASPPYAPNEREAGSASTGRLGRWCDPARGSGSSTLE